MPPDARRTRMNTKLKATPAQQERREPTVRFEIYDGEYVGTVEWSAPGDVALDVRDDQERAFLERFFEEEDAFLTGSIGAEEMATERRNSSAEAFARATYQLAAYSYRVRDPRGNVTRSEGEERS
jgi:hypothetical protein